MFCDARGHCRQSAKSKPQAVVLHRMWHTSSGVSVVQFMRYIRVNPRPLVSSSLVVQEKKLCFALICFSVHSPNFREHSGTCGGAVGIQCCQLEALPPLACLLPHDCVPRISVCLTLCILCRVAHHAIGVSSNVCGTIPDPVGRNFLSSLGTSPCRSFTSLASGVLRGSSMVAVCLSFSAMLFSGNRCTAMLGA